MTKCLTVPELQAEAAAIYAELEAIERRMRRLFNGLCVTLPAGTHRSDGDKAIKYTEWAATAMRNYMHPARLIGEFAESNPPIGAQGGYTDA